MKEIKKNAQAATNFLKGIANSSRLLILCALATGEKNVSELIETTGLAQTSMSQHLSKLKEERIVTFRREHRLLFYRIKNQAVLKIMEILYHEFCKNEEELK